MHVYAITNTVNGKLYVGQHVGEHLDKYLRRTVWEALSTSRRSKPALFQAIRKYGSAAFVIRSLVKPADKSQMDEMEKFFIRTLESQNREIGYNISAGGQGLFNPPVRVRQRMSDTAKQISKRLQAEGRGLFGRSPEQVVQDARKGGNTPSTLRGRSGGSASVWRRLQAENRGFFGMTREQRIANVDLIASSLGGQRGGRVGGPIANHNRWHVNRGIVNQCCELCKAAA